MKSERSILPYLLLTLAAFAWGGNIVVGRAVHGDIPPMAMTFFRWSVAFVIVLPLTFRKFRQEITIVQAHWKWLVLVSATGVAIFHGFVYTGLTSTTAINAGLMMATSPIIIPVFAFLIHRDKPTASQALGVIASLIGVGIVISRGNPHIVGNLTFNPGDLWILTAVPMWGVYSVIQKNRPQELSSRTLMLSITALGSLMLLPFYLWALSNQGGIIINFENLMTIAYISVFASVVAYFAWNKGIAAVGAIKAGPFLHVIPVSATLLAIVFLDETLQPFHYAGIGVIAFGIALATLKQPALK